MSKCDSNLFYMDNHTWLALGKIQTKTILVVYNNLTALGCDIRPDP